MLIVAIEDEYDKVNSFEEVGYDIIPGFKDEIDEEE